MAVLRCVADWPTGDNTRPDFPVTFELTLSPLQEPTGNAHGRNWVSCTAEVVLQSNIMLPPESLTTSTAIMLSRDLYRLVNDLRRFIKLSGVEQLTFVPVVPVFELWFSKLAEGKFRAIVWQDLDDHFGDTTHIAYQGIRFTTNQARINSFVTGLENDLKRVY